MSGFTEEQISFLVLYIVVLVMLGGAIIYIHKIKRKTFSYKIISAVSVFTIIVFTLLLFQAFFPSIILNGIVGVLAILLLPILFFIMSLGVIIYGLNAILTRRTFVRIPGLIYPKQSEGVEAIYFGILWVTAGAILILLELSALNIFLCQSSHWYCSFLNSGNNIIDPLDKFLEFIAQPIKHLKR